MANQIEKKFGALLRKARTKAGLTQEKLAFKANVSSNYIGRIERGTVSPSLSVVYSIAKAIGITVSKLTEGL
ncbi:MAG TPA: helix-turn-helix transcriptional regulator [Candidatus Dojkabacteria bacterium]|nr:helix-turn-helix transcriptional regulator [Candidatus Dojkabacteria bacterium]